MTGGFLITFREGLEAFLVVGIIISYLSRSGLKQYYKWVYVGVTLGVLSAFALAVVFQLFYSGFSSTMGELYIKLATMGLAVVVLSYMVIWMSHNSRSIKNTMEAKLTEVISAGSIFALIFMAYLAVVREGFETVLFLGALFGDQMGSGVLLGGLLGIAASIITTVLIFTGLKSLPIKTFFQITGALIILIAAGLCSNCIGILQDINALPIIKNNVVDIGWFMKDHSEVGIFFKALFGYTHSPSALQVVTYWGYLISMGWLLMGDRLYGKKEVVHA